MNSISSAKHPRQGVRHSAGLLLAFGLACATLAGCVNTPRPMPDTRLPDSFETPATALSKASLDQWWNNFNDQQLSDLIELALEKSPDARRAAAVLDEARSVRKGQVRQLYIPSTAVKGSAQRSRTDILSGSGENAKAGTSEDYAVNFDVSWELDLFGRRAASMSVVDNDMAAALFAYEGSRAALAASVAQSYFEARGLAVQLDDARQAARISEKLRDLAGKKAAAGLSTSADADRTEADQAQGQALVVDLEGQLAAARRSLLILVGNGVEPLHRLPIEPTLDAPPPVPATVPGELLVRRPDVREAQVRLASSVGNLKISELALLPTFNIVPGVGLSRNLLASTAPGGGKASTTSAVWAIGANLSIPMLNIPALLADVDSQNARARQAAIAYEKAIQTAYGEAESAMLRLSADRQRVLLLSAAEARAERAYQAARKGYGLGLTDLTTTLQSEQTWRSTRAAMTSAKVQAQLRTVQTYKALGGGWAPDFLPDGAQHNEASATSKGASQQ